MCEKYYLTRRNIDKQENIIWKAYDENWGDYIYKCNIDGADEFSLEQIEEMQRENIDDFVFDYAYRKEDILKLGKKFIDRKDIINLENFRIVKPNKPKRKPLSDGTLPLSEEELKEFWNMWTGLGRKHNSQYQIKRFWIDFKNDETVLMIEMSHHGINIGSSFVRDLEAILWLAERFELIKED